MKRFLFTIFIFFFVPNVIEAYSAESMIAMDLDSGRVLYEQNAYKEKLIASTTKIMTTIVAIEQMDLETSITVDERVLKAYGSGIYVEMGEVMTLKDLLYGLMLRSGNDAAIVIACGVSGSLEAFVEKMNQKAYEIGMSHTTFLNPHGLEENNGSGNTSTAYDMALLMKYAMNNEHFKTITGTKEYVGKSDKKTYHWENKNRLLKSYEYTNGGKTGFTEKARRTLVTTAEKEGKRVTIVTLNDGNDFENHQSLYETLFAKYDLASILKKENFSVPDFFYYGSNPLYIEKDVNVLATKEEVKDIHVTYEMQEHKKFKTGEVVGVAHIMLKDKELNSVKIYVKKLESEKKKGFFTRILSWLFQW